jgi:hypothetical protein
MKILSHLNLHKPTNNIIRNHINHPILPYPNYLLPSHRVSYNGRVLVGEICCGQLLGACVQWCWFPFEGENGGVLFFFLDGICSCLTFGFSLLDSPKACVAKGC